MRGPVVLIMVFLLVGAIVNIAVGWGCFLNEGARTHHHGVGVSRSFIDGWQIGLPFRSVQWQNDDSHDDFPEKAIWPGFAINTIFYAAVLLGGWMLLAFPVVMRRRRRSTRGLCPACAYPIGASEVCTECGAAVLPNESIAHQPRRPRGDGLSRAAKPRNYGGFIGALVVSGCRW